MNGAANALEARLQQDLGSMLFGMGPVIHRLILALVAGGHVLLEGVPGLGKTLLAKALAHSLGGRFKRVQCTADLMPADITGIHVYNAGEHRFELMQGPIFADVVLVDEINRTSPKTQSALLEAMEEGAVTIDRDTYRLPDGFLVLASQNPHEFEGTFPLPESQLDRFLLRIEIGYPEPATETRILAAYDRPASGHPEPASPPLPAGLLGRAREQAQAVHVAQPVYDYVAAVAAATRDHGQVGLGLSPRGALALMRCARVEAALRGGEFVTPDDVKAVAVPVMAHRLILSPEAVLEGVEPGPLAGAVLGQVPVPRGAPEPAG